MIKKNTCSYDSINETWIPIVLNLMEQQRGIDWGVMGSVTFGEKDRHCSAMVFCCACICCRIDTKVHHSVVLTQFSHYFSNLHFGW